MGRHEEAAALEKRRKFERLERLARLLDDKFEIPGTRIRFGLDPLIGLFPGIGDALTALSSVYIVGQARGMGAPKGVLVHMVWNTALDLLLGTIPLFGDLFDVGFKANRRNVELLREWIEESPQ